jgi:hypothetical protein
VTITPSDPSGDHHGASTEPTEQAASVSNDGSVALSWAGLIAGLAGLVLGGAAFLRSRPKSGTTAK